MAFWTPGSQKRQIYPVSSVDHHCQNLHHHDHICHLYTRTIKLYFFQAFVRRGFYDSASCLACFKTYDASKVTKISKKVKICQSRWCMNHAYIKWIHTCISRITKKSKINFSRTGKYRFTNHVEIKYLFTFHARQKRLFTYREKNIEDPLKNIGIMPIFTRDSLTFQKIFPE